MMKSSILEKLTSKRVRLKRLRSRVIDYYSRIPEGRLPDEQKEILEFLRDNDIAVFPYSFPQEYRAADIELFRDPANGLHYMLWEGKKLYYKDGRRGARAREYFNSLRLEQDARSPHRYLAGDFSVVEGDIVADVGAAEGNFSLSVIEKAGFVYLFETDPRWIGALEATFEPWREKVKIIRKFVSDRTEGDCIALDDFFAERSAPNFIKADVEGAEGRVLRGAQGILTKQRRLRLAICTYHRQEDADVLDHAVKEFGFSNSFSDGYMLYYYGRTNVVREPFLRRAVLRAVKEPVV